MLISKIEDKNRGYNMRICFDLDETLCTGYPYEDSKPILESIAVVNRLKANGHVIIIHTARGMSSKQGNIGKIVKDIGKLTLEQLDSWGVEYDEIVFGKPSADFYVDDKAINAALIPQLERILRSRL